MRTGILFDIKEFAVHDGPGIRTTVFMKGCPLRCQWCHNPEGLSAVPELMVSASACTGCGACRQACRHAACVACGACVPYCTAGLRRVVGQAYTSGALAQRLLRDRDFYEASGGGVTFSGGEPLAQWAFVREVIGGLDNIHVAVQTSGHSSDAAFADMTRAVDLVMLDIKLMDPAAHRHYTGVDNALILRHADMLRRGNTPFIIRVPLIPGVSDTLVNSERLADFLAGAPCLVGVELLPYHQTAGAKYAMTGRTYRVEFDTAAAPQAPLAPFAQRGIPVRVL